MVVVYLLVRYQIISRFSGTVTITYSYRRRDRFPLTDRCRICRCLSLKNVVDSRTIFAAHTPFVIIITIVVILFFTCALGLL